MILKFTKIVKHVKTWEIVGSIFSIDSAWSATECLPAGRNSL